MFISLTDLIMMKKLLTAILPVTVSSVQTWWLAYGKEFSPGRTQLPTSRHLCGALYCNPGNFSKLINLVNWRFGHFISYLAKKKGRWSSFARLRVICSVARTQANVREQRLVNARTSVPHVDSSFQTSILSVSGLRLLYWPRRAKFLLKLFVEVVQACVWLSKWAHLRPNEGPLGSWRSSKRWRGGLSLMKIYMYHLRGSTLKPLPEI